MLAVVGSLSFGRQSSMYRRLNQRSLPARLQVEHIAVVGGIAAVGRIAAMARIAAVAVLPAAL